MSSLTAPVVHTHLTTYSGDVYWRGKNRRSAQRLSWSKFAENCGPKFQDSYRIHALVNAYLEKLPHVPYRDLGLNCQVSTLQPDPRSWLFAQFASDWLHNDSRVRGMKPAFALDTVDAVCSILERS